MRGNMYILNAPSVRGQEINTFFYDAIREPGIVYRPPLHQVGMLTPLINHLRITNSRERQTVMTNAFAC